jgi:hypothetical protein
MVVEAIIELKPKSTAKAVRQMDKKGRDAIFEAKQNVGKNPHKIKVRPRGENMKRGTKQCVEVCGQSLKTIF